VTLLAVIGDVALAAVVVSLYRRTAPRDVIADRPPVTDASPPTTGWVLGGALAIGAVAATAITGWTLIDMEVHDQVEITAHRAGAAHAPENTVAALKRAIADEADWAEIDVQLTADNKLVVMHDIDLARVGGGSRRVDRATLAEVQALDVGSSFGQPFAGERIPTLHDMLAAADGKIRLNVELKPHGSDYADLTRLVIEQLRQANMLARCRLCSQSYESLQLARQIAPELPVGYIVATSVGDPAQLDVDFLMVKSSLAERRLIERARLREIEIHAWTVNDAAMVAPLLDAGVANIITDDPALVRHQLDEIRNLTLPQRLLLRTASAIGR
jgi:glycerophosphoryl diester phosphodiesterase